MSTEPGKWKAVEDFEGEAIELLEAFIESMMGDERFVTPAADFYDPVEDKWTHVYTDRASRLINRMMDRLSRLAERKFGFDAALGMNIQTHLYQEP